MALARSFSGILPHCSAYFVNRFGSTTPAPPLVAMLLSCMGLLGFDPPDEPPGCPPLGQAPPLGQDPFFWFSSSLMISSSRRTTSVCIFWVWGPPRANSSRPSMLSFFRALHPRPLPSPPSIPHTIPTAPTS